MPYVSPDHREQLQPVVNAIEQCLSNMKQSALTAGQMNYLLTMVLVYGSKMDRKIKEAGMFTYQDINELVGAIECCKLEMYRRVAVPYEDRKKNYHGDVYP